MTFDDLAAQWDGFLSPGRVARQDHALLLRKLFLPPDRGLISACANWLRTKPDADPPGFLQRLAAWLNADWPARADLKPSRELLLRVVQVCLEGCQQVRGHISQNPDGTAIDALADMYQFPRLSIRELVRHDLKPNATPRRPLATRLLRFPAVAEADDSRCQRDGYLVVLHLDLFPTPPEPGLKVADRLYPAPTMLPITFESGRTDKKDWDTAVRNAFTSTLTEPRFERLGPRISVRWSLSMAEGLPIPWEFTGNSCGGAFGLGLTTLLGEGLRVVGDSAS